MRRTFILTLLFFGGLLSSHAQTQSPEALCGTSILKDPAVQEAWARLLARNPDLMRLHSQRLASVNLQVGALDTFWTYNFLTPGTFERTAAELRATGTLSYVWVAVDQLENGNIDSNVVTVILQALESKTPGASRDSTKGILQLERQYFGDPPNINSSFLKGQGDGRTHFLIYDIKDGWTPGSGGYVAGYFYDVDVDPNVYPPASNRRDMLYIDSNPGIFNNGQRNPDAPLGTLAHEFQHLIHWNYDRDEDTFFDEGLSEYASYVCGYGLRRPDGFLNDPSVTFLGWRFGDNTRVLDDYSRAALWTLYLGEQYGSNFIQKLTQNPAIGSSGFNRALDSAGIVSSFTATVRDFHVANYVQSRQVNSAYGYIDTTVVRSKPKTYRNILGSTAQGGRSGLSPLAADYVRFFGPETLMTMFNLSSGTASIKALQFTNTQTSTGDVQPGLLYQAFFPGSERSEVVFVVHSNSESINLGYSYSSSGASKTAAAFELRNDDGSSFSSPNMLLSNFDTVFVLFEGFDGGKIDSVALWFQSGGPAGLFVRDANRSYNPVNNPTTGLGGRPRMAAPISFSVNDTGYFKTVVDLRSLNILSSPDFVVELIYGATAPQPQLRRDSDQSIVRSYLSLSLQPTPGRTMYASLGDFYLRAYLSHSPYIAPPPLPATFALFQNYPNPFNPSTTISYDLPRAERVRLEVFDLLGRRVAILVDEFQNAGSPPPVRFDASRLSAGVYFYRLTAGTFVETKKMMVVR